jgi:hypothetical protein
MSNVVICENPAGDTCIAIEIISPKESIDPIFIPGTIYELTDFNTNSNIYTTNSVIIDVNFQNLQNNQSFCKSLCFSRNYYKQFFCSFLILIIVFSILTIFSNNK